MPIPAALMALGRLAGGFGLGAAADWAGKKLGDTVFEAMNPAENPNLAAAAATAARIVPDAAAMFLSGGKNLLKRAPGVPGTPGGFVPGAAQDAGMLNSLGLGKVQAPPTGVVPGLENVLGKVEGRIVPPTEAIPGALGINRDAANRMFAAGMGASSQILPSGNSNANASVPTTVPANPTTPATAPPSNPQYTDAQDWWNRMPEDEFNKLLAQYPHLGSVQNGKRVLANINNVDNTDYANMSPEDFKKATEGKPGFGYIEGGPGGFQKIISPQSSGGGGGFGINTEGLNPHQATALAHMISALNQGQAHQANLEMMKDNRQQQLAANLLKQKELDEYRKQKELDAYDKLIEQQGTYGENKNNYGLGYFNAYLAGHTPPSARQQAFASIVKPYLAEKAKIEQKKGAPLTLAEEQVLQNNYRRYLTPQ